MTEPFKIYNDFFDLRPDDSTGIIRFYENNILLLDNKSEFKDKDEFSNYILILSQYTISLENLGKYTKAINYAEKTLKLIDLKASDYDINLNQFTLYWSILTTKGRAYYHLKDYSKSIIVFKKLLHWDPENDNFINWLNDSKSRKRNSINKYLYISATIIILVELFYGDQFSNTKIKVYLSGIGFFLFLIALINEYLMDKILKMIENK